METTVKYGHLTTIYGLSTKESKFAGWLSTPGYIDCNVYIQSLSPTADVKSSPESSQLSILNYSSLIFQIWPKLNFEANKEYQKLLRSQRNLQQVLAFEDSANNNDIDLLAERILKMGKRKDDENESNNALLESYLGMEVTYGSEIQLYHVDSKSFLNGKILCSDTDKSAYKFELSNDYGSGMIFRVFPRYKLRTEGETVQYQDQVVFYNIKLRSYMNFSCETPIEIDRPIEVPKGFQNLYKNFGLKTLDSNNIRYEAYLSNVKTQCYWQFFYHGYPELSTSSKIKGGDLIRIRHTEYQGELAVETCFSNDFEEVFLRKYQGEFSEEDTSISSIWEVEIDRSSYRGDQVLLTSSEHEKPEEHDDEEVHYRLRHLLSGKLLTLHDGNLPNDKKIVKIPGLRGDYEKGYVKGTVEFGETTADNPGYCEDNGYYHLKIDEMFLFVEGKSLYGIEGGQVNLGMTMARMTKKPEKGAKGMTGTMTNFSFKNTEGGTVYQPLQEKEVATLRYGVLCKKEKSNENAFQLIKVDEKEKQDVLFVGSSYATLVRFVNVIKAKKPEFLSNELIRKVSKSLQKLIAFVLRKEGQPNIESIDEGIPLVFRQKILKDMRIIELLTDILYWPFKNGLYDIKNLKDVDPEIVKIFKYTCRLIKHGIKDYRPNEIYASQWIDLLMKQTMLTDDENNFEVDVTLIELIDNNRRILQAKINPSTIEDFVGILVSQELHEKYVKLLSALTICDGDAMVMNQTEISKIIFENESNWKRLIFPVGFGAGNKLMINVYDEEIELSKFKAKSTEKDDKRIYDYFIQFVNLLSNLCRNRNYVAIEPLMTIYKLDVCFQIISNGDFEPELRTCFCRLILNLYIDKAPYTKLVLPNRVHVWEELTADKSDVLITCKQEISESLEKLKGFVSSHLSFLKSIGYQKAFETEANEFTQSVLLLGKNMLEFGFYKNAIELEDFIEPLFSLLNGTKDITTKEEDEARKLRMKDGSSTTLIKAGNKKKDKAKRKRRKHLRSDKGLANRLLRYEETENNQILHGCKKTCCEILTFVMDLRNDMRVNNFLCEFKRVLENPSEVSAFKGGHSSLRLSSHKRKQSRFGLSKVNIDDEGEAQSNNFLVIIDNICSSKTIDLSKSTFDPLAIYLDLLQYNNESVINLSYELLIRSYSQRKQLINLLKKLQILEDKPAVLTLKTIRELKMELSTLAEKTENWLGKDPDPEAKAKHKDYIDPVQQSEKCLEILEKLNRLLKTNKEGGGRKILEEPDGETIPRNEQEEDKMGEGFDDCLFQRSERPYSLNQNLMRNEYVYLEIIEILKFDIDTYAQFREGQIGRKERVQINDMQLKVLQKCYHVLARFAYENSDNQNILQEYLRSIFLRHMKTLPEVNGGMLIQGLFKDNKSLLSDKNFIDTIRIIMGVTDKLSVDSMLKANYLECLKVMTRYKERIYKNNQTILIKEICAKEYSNVFLTHIEKKDKDNLKETISKFRDDQVTNLNVHLSSEILYLGALLKILAITCQEENNATESKCQTFMPLKHVLELMEISQDCWFLKKHILLFYFHVYLETEREINEEKTNIDAFNNILMRDFDYIADNMASNNGPSIRTNKGVFTVKAMKLLYFKSLLPCLKQILSKKLVKEENREDFNKRLRDNMVKMSHWLDELSAKNRSLFMNFVNFLCDNKLAPDDFRLRIDKESFGSKPGFKKVVIAVATANESLPHQGSSKRIEGQGIENIKENKLQAHLEAIEQNEKFVERIENEFEGLVKNILNVADLTENVFEGLCTIQLEEITKALIKLISNSESSLSKELMKTSLTIFRKIIEMENPEKTNAAVDWSNDDYEAKKGAIIKRQNQLVHLGIVETLMAIVAESNTSREVREEAILVCISILLGGNKNAQTAFVKGMEEDRHNQFCLGLKKTLQTSFDSIKKAMNIVNKKIMENLDKIMKANNKAEIQQEIEENKKIQEKPIPEDPLSPDIGDTSPLKSHNVEFVVELSKIKEPTPEKLNENPIADLRLYDEDRRDLELLRRIFRLLQLFCEGHMQKLQNFLREQTFHGVKSGTSFDFIHMSAQFFASYIKFINIYCIDMGNQLLDFMIEAIQGPALENQVSFCKNKTVDVCKDFLAKFQRDSDYNRGGFFADDEIEAVDNVVTKSSKLLFSLIEGPPNEDNLSMLTEGLDFTFILKHLQGEFRDFVERVSEISLKRKPPIDLSTLNLEDFNEELPDHFDDDFLEAFNLYSLLTTLSDTAINKAGGQGVKDFLDNITDPVLLNTLEFFKMHCRSIEIDFKKTVIRVYFPVHPICRFLSKNSREKFNNYVNRETPNDKIKDMMNARDDFFDEMVHLAYLQKQVLVISSNRLNMLRDLSTCLAFCINFFILYSYSIVIDVENFNHGKVDASDPVVPIDQTINGLGYAQLATSCLMLFFWVIIYAPLILKTKWREAINNYRMTLTEEQKDVLDDFLAAETPISEANTSLATNLLFYKGPEDSIFKKPIKIMDKDGEEIESTSSDFGNFYTRLQYWWVSFRILFTANELMYMFFYILVSWMGVFISEIAYCLHLFDVINRFQTLTNVIRSVTYNAKQLILTLLFGLTLLYIYAMIGFYFFYDTYALQNLDQSNRNECTTLFQCYISTINFGLRNGGGIGDALTMMSYSQTNATYYAIRYFYDLSFFAFINIVFLNIIFGIIVDTFAELREKKNKMDEDKKTICFVCGENRYTFDRFSDGFENHIERDHQMWNYIYYIYLLKTKDSTDYNGVESYINEMLTSEDVAWVPLLKAMSLSLNEEKKEDIEEVISTQMQGLEVQLDTLKAKIEIVGKK